jgi:hypothetical protein
MHSSFLQKFQLAVPASFLIAEDKKEASSDYWKHFFVKSALEI